MAKEKLYIKGIEMAKADEVRKTQAEVANVASDLADYKLEINTSLEDIKEEVKDIIAEGGEAAPIFISSNGATISVENNQSNLLEVINALLDKIDYATDWFTANDTQTTLDLYPGNLPIIFKLGTNSYKVNRVTLRDASVNNNYLGITFHLDGSWSKDGQTSTEPYMLSYYEHIEDISFAGFYVDKGEYNNKTLTNIYSNTGLTERLYVSMSGTRYYNPVNYYQTLTTDNDITYEPTGDYNPATKKYVDDKALISAFTYFMESSTPFTGVDVINNPSQVITFNDADKGQLTEFINRYRQQKSFLHVVLQDGSRYLCDSLNDIDLNTQTNVFALELISYGEDVVNTIYMEGTRVVDSGEYIVNIARSTLTPNPKASQYVELREHIDTIVGDLNDLETTDKSNVVAAVNETLGTFTADYYTKDEVRLIPYAITTGLSDTASNTSLDITNKTQISNAITDAYKKGVKGIDVYLQFNTASNTQAIYTCSLIGNIQLKQTYYEGYYYHGTLHSLRRFYIAGTWSGNTFTADNARIMLAFDMWHFVSTQSNGFIDSYTIPTQTNFDKAPKLTNHNSITADNHLVDKQYVTEAINSIPGTDMSNYYTKEEVGSELSKKQNTLIAGDNITITNNIISASGSSDAATLDSTIPVIDMTDCFSDVGISTGARTLTEEGIDKLASLFTTHYQKNGHLDNLVFIIKADGVLDLFYSSSIANSASYLYFSRRGFRNTSGNGGNATTLLKEFLTQEQFYIVLDEANATISITGINGSASRTFSRFTGSGTLGDAVLGKNNTTAFTPTGEYHPATKKYVDDTITTKIANKQDTLIAGTNITIENNIISAINAGGGSGVGDSNLQVAEMPEPTEENEGAIVEYTGHDTDKFKRGYFYRSAVDHVYHIDSLTSTSNAYFNTGFTLKANYKIEMKAKLNTYVSNSKFFSGTDQNGYYCVRVYSNYYSYGVNGSTTNTTIPYELGTDLLITYNDDEGNITINDSIIGTGIATPTAPSSSYSTLYIFNSSSKMTVYYCKVWDKNTGELLAHFVPTQIDGSNTMYDIVNRIISKPYNISNLTAGTVDTELSHYRYWIGQDVQLTQPEYTWDNPIIHSKFYEDMQTIIDLWRKNIIANHNIAGYQLSHIVLNSSNSSSNYRAYYLYYTRVYHTYTYTRTITLYTTYNDYKVYTRASSSYGPTFSTSDTSYSFITSHQSLSNYLPKNNTSAFTPSGDYNPATKKYVDDMVATKDLTQYLSKDNIVEYSPVTAYNPATKQYVDNYANNLFNTAVGLKFKEAAELPTENIALNTVYLVGTESPYNMYVYAEDHWIIVGTTEIDLEPQEVFFEGNPEIVGNQYAMEQIGNYPFVLNEAGFWQSTNKGKDNTYSLCKITFNNTVPMTLPITYISSGENNYDYGIFSNIDCELQPTSTSDGATNSALVFKNCKGESSSTPKTITYELPAGQHFICIKFIKDSSNSSELDSLQFKLDGNFVAGVEYTLDTLQPNRIYKLNELGFLRITEAPLFKRESTIFARSAAGGMIVTLPATWTHLGDCPDFTVNNDGYSEGYCAGGKNYIISFMYGVAIWKVYDVTESADDGTDKEA